MRLFNLARHPTRAIRVALVAMLLALGLNAMAHASHQHDAVTSSNSAQHASACGYCTTFGSLADVPQPAAFDAIAKLLVLFTVAFLTAVIVRRTVTSANPRAPPLN